MNTHYLIYAEGKNWGDYERPNPKEIWDWCPRNLIDPYNDIVVNIDKEKNVNYDVFIKVVLKRNKLFSIDKETKEISWFEETGFTNY